MTIEYLKANYRKLGGKDCNLAAQCATCMYAFPAAYADGCKWEDDFDHYCIYKKKEEKK